MREGPPSSVSSTGYGQEGSGAFHRQIRIVAVEHAGGEYKCRRKCWLENEKMRSENNQI